MSRYVTPRHDGRVSRPDPRPFKPMRRGGFSPLDLPVWAAAIIGAAWIPHHVHSLGLALVAMAGVGIVGGVTVSAIKLLIHRQQSKPMVSLDDQPFS